jgi:DNA-binding NarL/FixJ family response regulator
MTKRRRRSLRLEVQRQRLVRMVFCGWPQEKIARKLHGTTGSVRNQLVSLDALRRV